MPLPLLFAAGGLLRGKLIHRRQTRLVQRAQGIDLGVLITVLVVGTLWLLPALGLGAAQLAALAMIAVYCSDLIVLGLGVRANPRAGGR